MILIWDSGETLDIKFGFDVGGALKHGLHASNVIFGIEEIDKGLRDLGPYKFEEYMLKLRRQLSVSKLRPDPAKKIKRS